MKIEEKYNVEIEKLSNLGFGITHVDGMVIFVENSCPKDKLKIKITHISKNYATGEVVEIIEPSIYRVEPKCKMMKVCGGCQLQFIDYNYQLKLKKQIVEDAMRSIAGTEIEVRE